MTDKELQEKLGPLNVDSQQLMIQLATMANMEWARIKRMVLVLDVDDMPRLFVESFIRSDGEPLKQVELQVSEEPKVVDTTSMLNERYRTHSPVPKLGD